MSRWFYSLLLFAGLAVALELLGVEIPPLLRFICAALGILPLAALIGRAVEAVAEHTGERIGGLLFATFGNITELIIGLFALSEGLVDVVRASIIGSILGNILLVLGVATMVGCLKHGRLRFETRPASQYASLLALCIAGLLLPAVAELLASRAGQSQVVERGIQLSDFIAILLLVGYAASILFSVFRFRDHGPGGEEATGESFEPLLGARSESALLRLLSYRQRLAQSNLPNKSGVLRELDRTLQAMVAPERAEAATAPQIQTPPSAASGGATAPSGGAQQQGAASREQTPGGEEHQQRPARPTESTAAEKKPNLWLALLLLAASTAGVAVVSDILVASIEPFTQLLGWNPAFVGLVFLPLIGGLPEYFNTINMALDKRMGMVLAASAGSSIQIALLVAPILVLGSLLAPQRLDLVFSIVEIAVLALAAFLFSEITHDGELVWLEGLLLILLYAIMGGTVFLFGA
ncbi:calcium:proton antiporter [Thermogemmatispora sp.]|uniref:calcium:proton antiporter n=1 Tax=Thermogemmatispora sp. TaxID=1968838 RepID=UPI0035E467BC